MYNRKIILISIILILIIFLSGCSSSLLISEHKAKNGTIDLTQVQFDNELVQLDGEWEFYWKQLIEPNELKKSFMTGYIDIPNTWNQFIESRESKKGYGYATYRLIFISDENRRLALKIPRVRTAYKLWINGELITSSGKVDRTRTSMVPQYIPKIAFLESQYGTNEILIQVSNFHQRSGGILEGIKLGSEEQILSLRYNAIAREIFVFGSLMFIGTYHLALFLFRKKDKSRLYFGLFCILIGIRTLLVGECFFIYLFPEFNWEIAHKIQTLTFYLGVPLMLKFFICIFPEYFHKWLIILATFIGATFGILVLFTQARIFSSVNYLYQIWTIVAIIYVLFILTRISIHKDKDSWIIIIGALVLLFTSLNDIIFLSPWINDNGPSILKNIFKTPNLSSFGQLIFAFLNSLVLARRFSNSLRQEEIMTKKLTDMNIHLDDLVLKRTKNLEISAKKIEQQKLELERVNNYLEYLALNDSLTGVWNRRKYDEIMKIEWNKSLEDKTPIALILIDIDDFKLFNDTYGHMAGDQCLAKIGETLKSSLSRSTDILARYGGEEFVVLLSDTSEEDAMKTANKLRNNILELNIHHRASSVSNFVTVSIGVTSVVPKDNLSYRDIFLTVDKALYQAKAEGKNQVKFRK